MEKTVEQFVELRDQQAIEAAIKALPSRLQIRILIELNAIAKETTLNACEEHLAGFLETLLDAGE